MSTRRVNRVKRKGDTDIRRKLGSGRRVCLKLSCILPLMLNITVELIPTKRNYLKVSSLSFLHIL